MWLDELFTELKKRGKESYTLTTSVTPGESIHIGKLRDMSIVYFLKQYLQSQGENVRTILYWDDYDVFYKGDKYNNQKGLPLFLVKNEFNQNVVTIWEKKYYQELLDLGIVFDEVVSQGKRYIDREYDNFLELSINDKEKITKIQKKDTAIFCRAYCPSCFKILKNSGDILKFFCPYCKKKIVYNSIAEINYKLPFSIEWACRWVKDNSDFEPIGIDHASPESVFQKSKAISKDVFGYTSPVVQRYEFVNGNYLKNGESSLNIASSNGLTISDFLKIFPKEVVLWIFFRTDPRKVLKIDISNKEYYLNCYLEFLTLFRKNSCSFSEFKCLVDIREDLYRVSKTSIKQLFYFLGFKYNNSDGEERVKQLFECKKIVSYFNYWYNFYNVKSNLCGKKNLTYEENILLCEVIKFLLQNRTENYQCFQKVKEIFKEKQKKIKMILFGSYKIPELSKMLFVYVNEILYYYREFIDEYNRFDDF